MSGFFGIIMSSLQPAISSKSLTSRANASTSSVNVSSTSNNRGTLSYSWKRSGKASTINATSSYATTITGLDTTDGTTTIYCDITDSVTGVTTSTPESIITWTAVVNQNIVISGTVTYNGSTQAYTLTGSPALPAPSGTPSTFINAGTYVYPTNITSITPGSDYTLGTVSGSFVINRATISGTAANPSLTYNGALQSGTVITSVLPSGATFTGSVSASGTAAGTYTSSITGSGNYQGTVNGGTFTISPATLTASTITGSATYTGSAQSVTVLSGINGTYTGSTSVSGTNAGSYTTTITGTGNYTGSVTGTLTISPTTLTASTRTGSATFNGDSQTVTVLSGINGTYTGSTSVSGTNAGSYTTTITGTGNYTGSVTGTLTISPATITFEGTGESRTYNGSTQSVGYIVGGAAMNNYNYTISGISATNAGTYTATITTTYSNYVISPIKNSFTWTMHPAPASSSPASGITTYQVYDGSPKSASVISGLSGLSYSGSSVASGVNAGTYSATVTLGGNYSGNVTGYLVISQAVGDISLYFGGYVAAGDTNTKLFINYLQRANATYTWSASVSGPGAGDAYLQPGFGVESRSYATSGFVVTITATISDPNYTASSATTSITFEAYVPPPSGGGGYGGGGGFIAE